MISNSIKITLILLISCVSIQSQNTFDVTKFKAIDGFLDEMASKQLIQFNSAIKPISRNEIAEHLVLISQSSNSLNNRQLKELKFLIREFDIDTAQFIDFAFNHALKNYRPWGDSFIKPVLFSYRDRLINFNLEPVAGFQWWKKGSESIYTKWSGMHASARLGNKWSGYIGLTDNFEKQILGADSFLTQRPAGSYKLSGIGLNSDGEYSTLIAELKYAWAWGNVALSYNRLEWGNHYNGSNIFGGRTTPFSQLKLQLNPVKWFELNYVHGWLNSDIIDSTRSYTFPNVLGYRKRDVFRKKYLAANMMTFTMMPHLKFSVGNSIIYSDSDIQPVYLIPFMFFNSPDQNLSANNNYAGQNSQFFLDISSRQIRNTHLYLSLFVDEISFRRMWNPSLQSNYLSIKTGLKWFNIANSNISFTTELTRSNPQVYKHVIPSSTFATNNYNLGHYLKDNSLNYFAAVELRPSQRFHLNASYNYSAHGKEYDLIPNASRWGLPFMASVEFETVDLNFSIVYYLYPNVFVFANFTQMNNSGNTIKYLPSYFHGNNFIISTGFSWN